MKMYNFNNKAHQHTITSALVKLSNMADDAKQAGNHEAAKRYNASWMRLDDVCERNGIYCAPYMIQVTYDDWKVLDAARKWYEGIRIARCEAMGVDPC